MEGFEDLSLDVDADDYAEAAAGDTPGVPRTYQSEEQFQIIKASYVAKHDAGNSYADLLQLVPALGEADTQDEDKIKLNKKQHALLGYAAGQLYYDKKYEELLRLCDRLHSRCQLDARLSKSVDRWTAKCKGKIV